MDHIYRAYQAGDHSPTWTFNTTEGHRIRFRFLEFQMPRLSYFLEIGDGSMIGKSSTLVRFERDTLPSNVTSVSQSAWLKTTVSDPGKQIESYSVSLKLEITAVEIRGAFYTFNLHILFALCMSKGSWFGILQQNITRKS